MRNLKERITAASHHYSVSNTYRKVGSVAVFIHRMEYDQKVIIRFLYKKRVSPEDTHARPEAQFGDAPYSERSVRRWC
jgi:hypothetical protein